MEFQRNFFSSCTRQSLTATAQRWCRRQWQRLEYLLFSSHHTLSLFIYFSTLLVFLFTYGCLLYWKIRFHSVARCAISFHKHIAYIQACRVWKGNEKRAEKKIPRYTQSKHIFLFSCLLIADDVAHHTYRIREPTVCECVVAYFSISIIFLLLHFSSSFRLTFVDAGSIVHHRFVE